LAYFVYAGPSQLEALFVVSIGADRERGFIPDFLLDLWHFLGRTGLQVAVEGFTTELGIRTTMVDLTISIPS
jgi:hypothetical protein